MSYSYEYFEETKRNGFECILPLPVIDILKQLHTKLNMNPDPVKQISFKKIYNNPISKPLEFGKRTPHHPNLKVDTDNYVNTIRLLLNKISDKTYVDCATKIINIIEKLSSNEISLLYNNMFEVILHNSFYSKLYADVYSLCITNNNQFLEGFHLQYDKYIQSFNDITYVDPNIDYDKYCINNSNNELRKSFGKFMFYLNKNTIIDISIIHNTLDILLSKIQELILVSNNISIVDEMVENIFIIYDKTNTINNKYKSTMVELSKYKSKQFPSLSNKSIFKIMDLI
jgi:hypothetical protein